MIREFTGQYRWLSNFSPVRIILDGIEYPSVEHAYMSAKSDCPEWKEFCSSPKNSPACVKIKSREITLKKDWNGIKLKVMEGCLRQKFSQEPYKTNLLKTGTAYIQEGNRWNDMFWGVCLRTNRGENNLGKLIMKIRSELQKQQTTKQ